MPVKVLVMIELVMIVLAALSTSPDSDAVSSTNNDWLNTTGPISVSRYMPVGSNAMFDSEVPITNVCRHSPVVASQILTVRSDEADASCRESCEKTTDLTPSLWPSSVCRHSPVVASQILTVRSSEADASCRESCEKATDLTPPLWPSSVCRHGLHLLLTIGLVVIHSGSSFFHRSRVKLPVGLNISADAYA